MLLAELAVRAFSDGLPEAPPAWGLWETQDKLAVIDRLAGRGGADVVLIGSSMMEVAADPARISLALGRTRPVFNAAVLGATSRMFAWWADEIVVPRLRPSTVVIGVGSREVNDNGASFVFDTTRSSRGAKIATGRAGFLDRLNEVAAEWSYLVRYRSVLRKPYSLFAGDPVADFVGQRIQVTDLGAPRDIRRLAPETYEVRKAFRDAVGSRAYRDFSVGGRELEALSHLVARLRSLRIEVVLVKMPVTEDAIRLHPRGMVDYRAFDRAIEAFAEDRGLQLLDLDTPFGDLDEFSDPHHLNSRGRARFTELLAAHLARLPASR